MELSSILKPEAIKVLSRTTSKKRLFQELSDVAAFCHSINANDANEALQDRENLGPTGVGHGVALPHARIKGLDCVCGVFVRLETPIDFSSVDRLPVDLVFALFAPLDSGVDHLKALALVSRTMRDSAICGKLRANTNASSLFSILTESQANQAA